MKHIYYVNEKPVYECHLSRKFLYGKLYFYKNNEMEILSSSIAYIHSELVKHKKLPTSGVWRRK